MDKIKILLQFVFKIIGYALLVASITTVITYGISWYFNLNFVKTLELAGFFLLILGAGSVMGGSSVIRDKYYNIAKSTIDIADANRKDIDQILGSYRFTILLALSTVFIFCLVGYLW